jgi:queuine tRNA-ribosyltransferase
MLELEVLGRCSKTQARVTRFHLNGKLVETPLFMPVGTQATVKTLDSCELEDLGFPIILANTFHLALRPGDEVVHAAGGLHGFMGFGGKILTDSGGFQVFSLKDLRKVDEEGVDFRSPIDGSSHRFTPARAVKIQRNLGADIMMAFDECPPGDASEDYIVQSMERTHRWAKLSLDEFKRDPGHQHLFGIIQGGIHKSLRLQSQAAIQSLEFDGIAIGGLSVGESKESMREVLEALAPAYCEKRVRYLMGVGTPGDFLTSVSQGIDLFDCVMPTRVGRHGKLYTRQGSINIINSKFKTEFEPLDPSCACKVCSRYSRAYLHHLFRTREFLGPRLASYHNLAFFKNFMDSMRQSILNDKFQEFKDSYASL